MAEQLQFLGIERGTAVAEEGGLVGLVAVVRRVAAFHDSRLASCRSDRMVRLLPWSVPPRGWRVRGLHVLDAAHLVLLTRVRLPSSCSSS